MTEKKLIKIEKSPTIIIVKYLKTTKYQIKYKTKTQ